ncbi:MAG: GNAT family N-acetyltransferase [Gemmatimonadetes bacterium]|nr:GNAT family N-acetyltransferase [Gemmatimonadota bacterium]
MRLEDAPAVSAMVYTAFRDSVAPRYSEEGQHDFFEYAAAERLAERLKQGHRLMLATAGERIIGVIEVRPPSHIAQLFMDRFYQDRGIARLLLEAAFPDSITQGGLTVTVNAPPDSVSGYGRMGFRIIAPEQVRSGVRFVPMVRNYGPVFFPVSLRKFVIMSLFSLGLYHLSWVYWNWRYERDRAGERLSPFWRTFFAPLWIHSLFHRVKRTAGETGVSAEWSVGLLTLTTIGLWLGWLLPMPWAMLSLLGFVPSIPVQRTVNDINLRLAPAAPRNDHYSLGNIILLVIGFALLAAIVWSMFVGVPEQRPGTVSV